MFLFAKGINRILDYICFFLYSHLINQTPEEEATSECGSGSGTNTDGRQLHAIDTQQQQQHNSLNF